jgi:O-succinylbenzoic acid--CoA ligase
VSSRPLHAVLLPPAEAPGRLLEALAAALDGTGPAILPLDPGLSRARLAELLEALAPAVVETADGPERYRSARPAPGVSPETALVIATSGSTGPPKGTELSAAALLASARASLRRIGARPGERWLLCLPAFHIAGMQVLVRSLLAGSAPAAGGRLEPGTLAASGCAHVAMVPTQLRRLVEAGADLSAVATILLGGAAVPPGLLDDARAAGGRVVTTYGMSETSGGCMYDGMPLDDVSVGIGPAGRIRIAGPVLFSGYRLRPDQAALARDGRWFLTSDLGSIGPSGELLVRGRADDVIITGGEKVVAEEVEAALATCAGVREAAVVGRPDAEWGELVTAVVVAQDPAAPPPLAEIRAHVRDRLPAWAAPAALLLVPDLPMLPSGKPDRAALRARAVEALRWGDPACSRAHGTHTGTNGRAERY